MLTSDALAKAIEEMERAYERNKLTDHVYGVEAGASPIAAWPKSPCKILFLDFDGVLNSETSARQTGNRYKFSKDSVAALNKILLRTRAYVVISSSWRESWTLTENAAFLEHAGVLKGHVVGKTTALGKERGLEIDAWLNSVPYRVQAFAILDDRDDMLMHMHRLVQTNPEIGLTAELADKAIALLT
jgi:hypothetical protein